MPPTLYVVLRREAISYRVEVGTADAQYVAQVKLLLEHSARLGHNEVLMALANRRQEICSVTFP